MASVLTKLSVFVLVVGVLVALNQAFPGVTAHFAAHAVLPEHEVLLAFSGLPQPPLAPSALFYLYTNFSEAFLMDFAQIPVLAMDSLLESKQSRPSPWPWTSLWSS